MYRLHMYLNETRITQDVTAFNHMGGCKLTYCYCLQWHSNLHQWCLNVWCAKSILHNWDILQMPGIILKYVTDVLPSN